MSSEQTYAEPSIDDLIGTYEREQRPIVHISYSAKDFSPPSKLSSSLHSARASDEGLVNTIKEYKMINRRILGEFGYESIPSLLRPVEALRRYAHSMLTGGQHDTDRVMEICETYVNQLVSTHRALITSLKAYERTESALESYHHSLEDHIIDVARKKSDVEGRITTLSGAVEAYADKAPHDGSIADKVEYQRNKRSMDKDLRSLKALNLRMTQDLNQTMTLVELTSEASEILEVSKSMNYMAADSAQGLIGQLRLNVDLYRTNAKSTDIALELGSQLTTAAKLTDLLSQGTHSRMNALGHVIKNFSLPSGSGAESIGRGGLVNGLRSYLEQMQELNDEEAKMKMDDGLA